MAGATISFNPTIAFTSASAFTYENDDVDSAFVLGPISGTYTYTRDSDASATITLNGPGIGDVGVDTFTFQIRNFRGSATEITSFEIVADGESFRSQFLRVCLLQVIHQEVAIVHFRTTKMLSLSPRCLPILIGTFCDLHSHLRLVSR